MIDMKNILENVIIDSWVERFRRSPNQVNQPHESDAELIEMPGDPDRYMAVTIDTVAEEISSGLYRDPYTMGWITVMASLSDLAAVGADPLGLVISVSLESSQDRAFANTIAQGMEGACRTLDVFILGGDTNETSYVSLTSCALGLVMRKNLMMRRGCKPGDAVFVTDGVGLGNAFALVRLGGYPDDYFPEKSYRPIANLAEGRIVREFASCCMDSSDGLLATLDQLMRINQLGFAIDGDWEKILAPKVMEFCQHTHTPPWLMAAGPHGEFKLVFTVPERSVDSFLMHAQSKGFSPIHIGSVQKTPAISLLLTNGKKIDVDVAPLRNLLYDLKGDVQRYLKEFRDIGRKWGLE
jgi:thiamine-monophosphate kinase